MIRVRANFTVCADVVIQLILSFSVFCMVQKNKTRVLAVPCYQSTFKGKESWEKLLVWIIPLLIWKFARFLSGSSVRIPACADVSTAYVFHTRPWVMLCDNFLSGRGPTDNKVLWPASQNVWENGALLTRVHRNTLLHTTVYGHRWQCLIMVNEKWLIREPEPVSLTLVINPRAKTLRCQFEKSKGRERVRQFWDGTER